MPTNLLGLLQAFFSLILSNPDLIPKLVTQIQVIADVITTLFAGKNLSPEQLANIDKAYEDVNALAATLEDAALAEETPPPATEQ